MILLFMIIYEFLIYESNMIYYNNMFFCELGDICIFFGLYCKFFYYYICYREFFFVNIMGYYSKMYIFFLLFVFLDSIYVFFFFEQNYYMCKFNLFKSCKCKMYDKCIGCQG